MVREGGFAFLRKSHGGCNSPPDCCQEPPFESTKSKKTSFRLSNCWWGKVDSLFCGKATAVATVPRTVAKSRLSNPQKSKKTSFRLSNCWWGKVDSNHRRHRQQIYSLSPLATREFPHIQLPALTRWSWWTDSNPRPAEYKSAALPTELHQRNASFNIIANEDCFVNTYFAD